MDSRIAHSHRPVRLHTLRLGMAILATPLALAGGLPHAAAGGVSAVVREAVEMAARRSGRQLGESAARESVEHAIATAVTRHGPKAATTLADGGLELVEASARYGDDVMRIAVEASPAARRTLALDPGGLLPLVREFGPEALELEAKSPGLARRVYGGFGSEAARKIAREVPAEDVPRLVSYAEKADSPQTRRLLLDAYAKEGPGLFGRIPPKLVLAGGLTTSMIIGTHRATAPFAAVARQIASDPALSRRALDWTAVIGGGLLALIVWTVLRACGLLGSRAVACRAASPPISQPTPPVRTTPASPPSTGVFRIV
jgi:hypothetical protein